jgi:transposase InsO family protein
MKAFFSAKELAGLPGMPKTASGIIRKAKKNTWGSKKLQDRGGGYEYAAHCLPQETRSHLAIRDIAESSIKGEVSGRHAKLKDTMTELQIQTQAETGLIGSANLKGKAKLRMEAKIVFLNARRQYIQHCGLKISKGHLHFCMLYNENDIEIDPWVRDLIPSVHSATVYRWIERIKHEGNHGLSGHYGRRKGSSKIDTNEELKQFTLGMLREYPHISSALLYRSLVERFSDREMILPGKRATERWVNKWKNENEDAYLATVNPDEWKNKRMLAFGDAAAHVHRLNQEWQLDGTPADILLEDGRYSLTALIDVYSRRSIILVTKTAISESNARLMRKSIVKWGMPEVAKTDNGKDYISMHITRVLSGLHIEQQRSAPFCPEKKPFVERFFRTFSSDVLELMPGFIGHNVAERSAIEARKAFSDRLFKKDHQIEIKMTAEELQKFCDNWCENIYHQRVHGSLKGKTPEQMAVQWPEPLRLIKNQRALDLLLQPVVGGIGDGLRTIGKKGLKINNIFYIAQELATWSIEHPHEKVLCLQDPDDFGRIMVYGDNEFICIARSDYEGLERQEIASKSKQLQQKAVTEAKRELKRIAKKANVKDIAEEMLREKTEQSNITRLPVGETHTTPALDAASVADRARRDVFVIDAKQLNANKQSRKLLNSVHEEQKLAEKWPDPMSLNDVQKYRYSKKIKERLDAGEDAPDYIHIFFNSFYEGDTYESIDKTYRELGAKHD